MTPHIHRVNAAEQATRTWKEHFIAGLESTDTQFPMNRWCCLIPQTKMTLNMLIPFQRNPTMLAYTAIEGPFDFNKTPIKPPGTKVLVQKNHNNGKLGASMEYRDGTSAQKWSTTGATRAIHQEK